MVWYSKPAALDVVQGCSVQTFNYNFNIILYNHNFQIVGNLEKKILSIYSLYFMHILKVGNKMIFSLLN